MTYKFKIVILFFLSIPFANKNDSQLWYSFEIGKSINNFDIELTKEYRFKDDYELFHKSLTEISFSYKTFQHFKFSTFYRYISYNDKFKSRAGISNKMNFNLKEIEFSFKSKLQKDFLNNIFPEEFVFRNKLSIEYAYLPFFTPYISYESFHQFIKKNWDFEKYRSSFGIEYRISKITSLKLFYTYNGEFDKNSFEITNIIGLNYEFSF